MVVVVGIGALIGTWMLLFVAVAGITEAWMAPWDVRLNRPALGTIERTLNDFFEEEPGAIMFAGLLVTISVGLFLTRMVFSANRTRIPWTFAAANLGFVFVGIPLAAGTNVLPYLWLPQPRPEPDIGYHLVWPSALSLLALGGVLLWMQWRFTRCTDKASDIPN